MHRTLHWLQRGSCGEDGISLMSVELPDIAVFSPASYTHLFQVVSSHEARSIGTILFVRGGKLAGEKICEILI